MLVNHMRFDPTEPRLRPHDSLRGGRRLNAPPIAVTSDYAKRAAAAGDRTGDRLAAHDRRGSTLGEFGSWWVAHLLACVPEILRRWCREPPSALVLEPVSPAVTPFESFTVIQRRQRCERRVGYFHADRRTGTAAANLSRAWRQQRTVAIRVPSELLLTRRLTLPPMAERELASDLRNRLDSLTPFQPDEVFWSWRVARDKAANNMLAVTVSLIPRASLEPGFTALVRAGIVPTRLEVVLSGQDAEVIRLAEPRNRGSAGRHVSAVAVAFCAITAAVALVGPFIRQEMRIAALDTAIAELQPRAAQAEVLRQRVSSDAAASQAIAAEEARLGDALHALAALAHILPDDTYLNKLTLQQGQLTISGRSARPARLITALAANSAMRNPTFAAPVTRADGDSADQFVIRATLAP